MWSENQTPEPIFECQQCGECCWGYGGTHITEADAYQIADFLNLSLETFLTQRCEQSGKRWLLRQAPNGYCLFQHNQRCSIHPVKPAMCRDWPYLKAVLTDIRNWQTMGSVCPGIRQDADEYEIQRVIQRYWETRDRR